jgi:phosphatidylethanolamine/phosphatidyl-N-methylethanolamine N-methyltransferase
MRVGSPVPSGPHLAAAVAQQIDPAAGGLVVELGPGTGAVTAAILRRGVAPSRLLAVESDPTFAAALGEAFPAVTIVRGDAFDLTRLLRARGHAEPLAAIVCGLPVLNRPVAVRRKLLADAIRLLAPGSPFIQFTYGARPPIPPTGGVIVERAAIVWRNLPPMHVWVYRADDVPASKMD